MQINRETLKNIRQERGSTSNCSFNRSTHQVHTFMQKHNVPTQTKRYFLLAQQKHFKIERLHGEVIGLGCDIILL